ncbi:MAG TPA: hypothetical protein VH396_10435, partial [Chitinophagaceae bacterium]
FCKESWALVMVVTSNKPMIEASIFFIQKFPLETYKNKNGLNYLYLRKLQPCKNQKCKLAIFFIK